MTGRTLRYHQSYEVSLRELVDRPELNPTIAQSEAMIAFNAELGIEISGNLRLLQTEDRELSGDYVPPLNFIYRIIDELTVELLFVEEDRERLGS